MAVAQTDFPVYRLLNKVKAGSVKKINTMNASFKQMENIGWFLDGARALGVAPTDCFQTVDLYEEKNINQVIQMIHALGRVSRTVAGFSGPFLGPKQADKNERNFTEDQLKQGEAVVPMISRGSPGANQAGMFDTSRDIVKGAGAREKTMGKNKYVLSWWNSLISAF